MASIATLAKPILVPHINGYVSSPNKASLTPPGAIASKFPFLRMSAQVSIVPGYMWKQSIRASNAIKMEKKKIEKF